METVVSRTAGQVCSVDCGAELEWRETLSICGSQYSPRPPVKCDRDLTLEEQQIYKRLCDNPMVAFSIKNEMNQIVVAQRLMDMRIVRWVTEDRKPSFAINCQIFEAVPPVNRDLLKDV